MIKYIVISAIVKPAGMLSDKIPCPAPGRRHTKTPTVFAVGVVRVVFYAVIFANFSVPPTLVNFQPSQSPPLISVS